MTMPVEQSNLRQRIQSGQQLLLAEISPPTTGDSAAVRELARRYAGKVHALGVSDNRHKISMSALVAASLVANEGAEPILHLATRDRNRIALVSEALGAQALGIRNLLCTSGEHQTLGSFRAAKNVFDLDPVQLLETYRDLADNGAAVGEKQISPTPVFCLGGTAAPDADPLELQVMRLAKKVAAGAQFLITQPIFDIERFGAWWDEIVRRKLHEKVAIVAGIQPLASGKVAAELASGRPQTPIPAETMARLNSAGAADAQRTAGIAIALETIEKLAAFRGLRGLQICGDDDPQAALEIIDKSALGTN
jgi:methylenetetrahydrofolate reductase (NADPH)